MAALTTVDQSGATAGRDIIAGNKTRYEIHNHSPPSVVERLLANLNQEMEANAQVRETIESLKRFYEKRSHDGIEGLEAKLRASGRNNEILTALEKKEMFAKALEQWSLYTSAQEIFVHLLAKAEHEFSMHVLPQITVLPPHEVNLLVTNRIVEPMVAQCGSSVFKMNHGLAMGMFYWLAEQCFVRWHQ